VEQNRRFGWDFMKVQLRGSYYAEAWGCSYEWRVPETGPETAEFVIKSAEDFKKLRKIDPTKGIFAEHIQVAKSLGEAFAGSVPFVQTIFSPLTVADMLSGTLVGQKTEPGPVKRFIKENPEELQYGLSIISQSLADYAREAVRAGAAGILLSTTAWASFDTITEDEYKKFGRTYDLPIFEAATKEGAAFNVLHICRENIMFDLLSDYPVQVISYDSTSPRNPSLKEAIRRTNKALWTGVNHKTTLLNGPPESITAEVHSALDQTKGKRFMLGPGCAISLKTPEAHLLEVKKAVSTWKRK